MMVSEKVPRAFYQQVKDYILGKIDSGEWLPDTKVPSENELVKSLKVSRMTVNRALRELAESQRLIRVQGVGTYVAHPKPITTIFEVRSIDDEIKEWGGTYSCVVELLKKERAFEALALAMKIEVGATVYHSVIVHQSDEKPAMLADRFVNPLYAPDYIKQDFTKITPAKYLLKTVPISDVEHIIEAKLPDARVQRLLKIGPHEPCLYLHRQTWGGGGVVAHSLLIYPGSTYRMGGRFKPLFDKEAPISSEKDRNEY